MIRRSLLILVSAAMLAPSIAWAQDAEAFLGEWVLTVDAPRRGPVNRPLKITETDGKLSAVYGSETKRFEDIIVTDVTVKGSEATLKFIQDSLQGVEPVVMTLTMKDGALIVKIVRAGVTTQNGTGKRKG